MGINLVIACHRHRIYSYSMRGEEPWDVQWWMRGEHGKCMEQRCVEVFRDCDDYPEYDEAWEHENRPALHKADLKTWIVAGT